MPQTPFQLPTFITAEHGQTMSEAAVILALVVVIVMATVTLFGNALGNYWSQLAQTLPGG